jgi:hypothetical protein
MTEEYKIGLIRHFLSEGRYEDACVLAAAPGMCLYRGRLHRNVLGEAIIRDAPLWVIERILAICPEAAKNVDAEGFTPLHQAITSGRPDQTELVKILLPAFPDAAAIPNRGHLLPIFTSVMKYPDMETFRLLYDAYPDSLAKEDDCGRTLLYHAVLVSFGISKAILELRPDAIKDVDGAGWLPIHMFCNSGTINMAREIFWLLYNAYPEAVYAPLDEVEDGTIVHLAVQNWLLPDDIADFLIKELPEAAAKLAGQGRDGLPFRCV